MSFFEVLDNNVCTITGNGFIKVQGPIQVTSSQQISSEQISSEQVLSQQFYSFSNSLDSSASEFENFNTSLSGTSFQFSNDKSFNVGSTGYTEVTLSNNKIEFTSEIHIELPDDITISPPSIFTKTSGEKEYLLYKNVNNGLYDIVVIFDCTNNTVEVKQLYNEQQLGSDIDGEGNNNYSGWSVSLSSDGTIVAIGAYGYDIELGHVRVYQRDTANTTTHPYGWSQLGYDIDGEAYGDKSGWNVSLSSDGTIVAIGANLNNGTGLLSDYNSGHVRVYKWRQYTQDDDSIYHYESRQHGTTNTRPLIITEDTSTEPVVGKYYWTQLGSDIDGEEESDQSGYSVSLSSDGSIVAIGAFKNDGENGTNSGNVCVYGYNGTTWSKLGGDIDGAASVDYSGQSVSLSSNGTIVAIGAPNNDGNGTDSGHVRVYEYKIPTEDEWDNGNVIKDNDTQQVSGKKYWTQLGSDIDGEAAGDLSGRSVSLSSNGTIVAIGAPNNDGNGTDSGHVRVYKWRQYTQDDDSIYHYGSREQGTTNTRPLIITEDTSTEPVVGKYYWTQLGSDIDGEASGDESSYRISLSSDGTIIVIGADYNTGVNGAYSGHARIYKYNETDDTWIKIYKDIDGEESNDYSGWDVSLSSDGTIVAIGAYGHSSIKGRVKIYRLPTNPIATISSFNIPDTISLTSIEKKPYSIISVSEYKSIEEYESLINSSTITGNTSIAINYTDGFYIDDIQYTTINITGSRIQFYEDNVYFDIGNGVTSGTKKTIINTTDTNSKLQILYDIPDNRYIIAELDCLHNQANIIRYTNIIQYNKALQLGTDIDGVANYDYSGTSVSLSSDGTIVAIGAPYHDSYKGHVRVYEYTNGSWSQLGSDIDGEETYNQSGISVSLSGDGTIVAIGANLNNEDEKSWGSSGHVRVYEWRQYTQDDKNDSIYHYSSREQGTTNTKPLIITEDTSTEPVVGNYYWTQLGSDIEGEEYGDESGISVSLSSDGTIVAIGANLNTGVNGASSGHVRVYQRDTANTTTHPYGWSQLGDDIDGAASADNSGKSISLSSNGYTVAIGAHLHDGVNGDNSGQVRVYEYTNGSWTKLGNDINGEASGDECGISVSLSSDGTILAIGAHLNNQNGTESGNVYVYKYRYGYWTQLGDNIYGEASGDKNGTSVSLSSDGTIVAIWAPYNNGNGSDSGRTRIYKYNGENWIKLYLSIDGEASNDRSGTSVSLSSDGTIVAIGEPYHNSYKGHVKIYKLILDDTETQTLGVKYRAGKDIVEVDVSPSQVGGYNYLIDN